MGGDFAFNNVPNNTASSWWRDPGLRKLVFFMATLTVSAVGLAIARGSSEPDDRLEAAWMAR